MLNGPRVSRISLVRKEKVCGGKDLLKSQVLSSEWKTEWLREDASGDSEDGEEDDDKLPCVIGESEGDCIWRGSRRSVTYEQRYTQSNRTEENKTPSEIEKQTIECLCSLIWRQNVGNKMPCIFSYGLGGERICLQILDTRPLPSIPAFVTLQHLH